MALHCGLLRPGPLGWLSAWGLATPEGCAAGLGAGQRAALLVLLVGGLCWLVLHLHLLTLHMYLAATNQTTLELLKVGNHGYGVYKLPSQPNARGCQGPYRPGHTHEGKVCKVTAGGGAEHYTYGALMQQHRIVYEVA